MRVLSPSDGPACNLGKGGDIRILLFADTPSTKMEHYSAARYARRNRLAKTWELSAVDAEVRWDSTPHALGTLQLDRLQPLEAPHPAFVAVLATCAALGPVLLNPVAFRTALKTLAAKIRTSHRAYPHRRMSVHFSNRSIGLRPLESDGLHSWAVRTTIQQVFPGVHSLEPEVLYHCGF